VFDLAEDGEIAIAHFFEHSAAVMDEVVEIVEAGVANMELHGIRCSRISR
jgi:hypothetical protein